MSAIDNWIDQQTRAPVEPVRPLAAPLSRYDLGPGAPRGIEPTQLLRWAAGQPSALASLAQRERRASQPTSGTSVSTGNSTGSIAHSTTGRVVSNPHG